MHAPELVVDSDRRLVEVGWVTIEPLPEADQAAVERARRQVLADFEAQYPEFAWRMPHIAHVRDDADARVETVDLIDRAALEIEAKRWDFAIVVTNAELRSHFKPYALGATARAVAAAAVSTLRIDPEPLREEANVERRSEVMARRLRALVTLVLYRLNGVDLEEPEAPDAFDAPLEPDEEASERFVESLRDVADPRVEEGRRRRLGAFDFYRRALSSNRRALAQMIVQAHPWQFPWRLSRLTGAALSALVILLMTAEVWDLAMSQSPVAMAVVSALVLVATTTFVLERQKLLTRRTRRLAEQTAVANVAAVFVVGIGMISTYVFLFGLTLLLGYLLFAESLVLRWAESLNGALVLTDHFVLAAFIASIGLVIGALGASFEEQAYFRHVVRIDAEI